MSGWLHKLPYPLTKVPRNNSAPGFVLAGTPDPQWSYQLDPRPSSVPSDVRNKFMTHYFESQFAPGHFCESPIQISSNYNRTPPSPIAPSLTPDASWEMDTSTSSYSSAAVTTYAEDYAMPLLCPFPEKPILTNRLEQSIDDLDDF